MSMHFSKTAEYAIRVLIYLHRNEGVLQPVSVLHRELGLPYKYLTRLMTRLVKEGLVHAARGRDGGVSLAKKGEEIRLCDILGAIGETSESSRCILGFDSCDAANPCALHDQWTAPKGMIDTMIHSTTLASLSGNVHTRI